MKVEIDTYLNAANGDQFTFSRKNHGGFNDPRAFLESEITHVVSGIFTNPHMELQPYDFTVRISIDATRSFQTISAIKVVNDHLVKGEDFTLQLTCQKFRQANQVQNVTMQLPGNLPDGEYEIVVTAGGSAPQTNSIFALEQAGRPKESTLATWLDRLANDNRQDQIRCLFRPVEPKEIVTTKKRNIPTRLADHGKFLEKLAKKVDERRIDAEAMIVMTLPVSSPTSGEQSLRVRFGAASEELDQISSVEEDEEQI
jgi:hypothetical protein